MVKVVNRQVKEVIIPDNYNGLEVTEIANNGFMSCLNLEKVFIPETVSRLGNNAFMGCRNLVTVQGMPNVKEIGNNAFALCSKLTNLIIPGKVETLGTTVVKNVVNPVYVRSTKEKITSLNSEWKTSGPEKIIYGNDLACTEIKVGNILTGYSVNGWQNLNADLSNTSNTRIICSYQNDNGSYYPILAISECAFSLGNYKNMSIEYDPEHVEPNYSVELKDDAFSGLMATSLDIQVNITLSGKNVFAGSSINSISLPNTINEIPDFTFLACQSLETLRFNGEEINHLPSSITRIGVSAFESCIALTEIYIPQQTSYVGENAFEQWGVSIIQVIHVDRFDPYDWHSQWLGISGQPTLKFRESTVTLEKDGGTGGTEEVIVGYGGDMPSADKPQKERCPFQGYFSEKNGKGIQFYDQNMNSVSKWNAKQNIIYASWGDKECKITFNKQGGEGGSDGIASIKKGDNLPDNLTAPTRIGYEFKGYFAEPNGKGQRYYNAEMLPTYYMNVGDDITFYANWEAIEYKINYLGIPENLDNPNPTSYTVEQLPIVLVPFDSDGLHVTLSLERIEKGTIGDIDVQCTPNFIEYNIKYDLNGGINNKDNPSTFTVETEVLLKDPEHLTLDFAGWSYNGTIITNLNGITENITLTATWKAIKTINVTSAFTTLYITDSKANINFQVGFKNNCTINISPETTYVRIYGNGRVYNLNIHIEYRTNHFNLALDNIAIYAHSGQYAIDMTSSDILLPVNPSSLPKLNLYTYNTVIIKGCSMASASMLNMGNDGVAAISCMALTVHTADMLIIQGGNAEDGTYANGMTTSGGNGGIGILSDSDVYIDCSNVIIAGGLAGDGGSGFYKGYGGKGAPPISGRKSSIYVFILKTAKNVLLLQSLDGEDGTGNDPGLGGVTFPTNPPIISDGGIIKPISIADLVLRPIGDQGVVPPPTDPPFIILPND